MDRYKAGQLTPGSPEYERALDYKSDRETFCCSTQHCKHIGKHCDYSTYRSRAMEFDAFEAGEAAARHLKNSRSRDTYEEYVDIMNEKGRHE